MVSQRRRNDAAKRLHRRGYYGAGRLPCDWRAVSPRDGLGPWRRSYSQVGRMLATVGASLTRVVRQSKRPFPSALVRSDRSARSRVLLPCRPPTAADACRNEQVPVGEVPVTPRLVCFCFLRRLLLMSFVNLIDDDAIVVDVRMRDVRRPREEGEQHLVVRGAPWPARVGRCQSSPVSISGTPGHARKDGMIPHTVGLRGGQCCRASDLDRPRD